MARGANLESQNRSAGTSFGSKSGPGDKSRFDRFFCQNPSGQTKFRGMQILV